MTLNGTNEIDPYLIAPDIENAMADMDLNSPKPQLVDQAGGEEDTRDHLQIKILAETATDDTRKRAAMETASNTTATTELDEISDLPMGHDEYFAMLANGRAILQWIPVYCPSDREDPLPEVLFPQVHLFSQNDLENNTLRFALPDGWNTTKDEHKSLLTTSVRGQIKYYCTKLDQKLPANAERKHNPQVQLRYIHKRTREFDCTFTDWWTYHRLINTTYLREILVSLPNKKKQFTDPVPIKIQFTTPPVPASVISILVESVPSLNHDTAEHMAENLVAILQPHTLQCFGVYASGVGIDEEDAKQNLTGTLKIAIKIDESPTFPMAEAANIPGFWQVGERMLELQFRGRFPYCPNCKGRAGIRQGKHTQTECTNYTCKACGKKGHRSEDPRCERHPSQNTQDRRAAKPTPPPKPKTNNDKNDKNDKDDKDAQEPPTQTPTPNKET